MEFVLLLIGAAVGGAVGYNFGQRSKPAALQSNAADAVVRFLRAVTASQLPRETVMAVQHVVSREYDPDTAAYIHRELSETPGQAGNE